MRKERFNSFIITVDTINSFINSFREKQTSCYSSPGTQPFPANSLFQLFLKMSPLSNLSRKKAGGQKMSSPKKGCSSAVECVSYLHQVQYGTAVWYTMNINRGNMSRN